MDLIVKLTGSITESNFPEYKDELLQKISEINTDLQTDDDFFIAEESVKSCKAAEDAIDAAREAALDQTKDIRELFEAMTEVSEKLRDTRLDLSRKIKTRKEELKNEAIKNGVNTLKEKIKECNADPFATTRFVVDSDVFRNLVKGKRKLDSIKKAISKEVFRQLEVFSLYAKAIAVNRETISAFKQDYSTLFYDEDKLLVMGADELANVISSRVNRYKAEEEARKLREEKEAAEKKQAEAETEQLQEQEAPPVEVKVPQKSFVDPAYEVLPESTVSGFVMTVVMSCTDDMAREIAKTVHSALSGYGDSIESVNLKRR